MSYEKWENFPELSKFLRPFGFTKTTVPLLKMLACIECQTEHFGSATLRETYREGCLAASTAAGLSGVLEARGVIERERMEPPLEATPGRPPTQLRFVNQPPASLSEMLLEFRSCGRDQVTTPPPTTTSPS